MVCGHLGCFVDCGLWSFFARSGFFSAVLKSRNTRYCFILLANNRPSSLRMFPRRGSITLLTGVIYLETSFQYCLSPNMTSPIFTIMNIPHTSMRKNRERYLRDTLLFSCLRGSLLSVMLLIWAVCTAVQLRVANQNRYWLQSFQYMTAYSWPIRHLWC